MNEPVVSVVVPTFNRCAFLREALESLRVQVYTQFECLVIDDGSVDETADLLTEISAHDPRFRRIQVPTQGGAARARNLGLRSSRGRWVAFLDDDDRARPERLARQVAWMEAHPDAGIVCSYVEEFGARKGRWPRMTGCRDFSVDTLIRGNCVATSTVMASRALLDDLGGFEVSLATCEDFDLWLRVAAGARVHLLDEVLVEYRVHPGGLSASEERMCEGLERVYARLLQRGAIDRAAWHQLCARVGLRRARTAPTVRARWAHRLAALTASCEGILIRLLRRQEVGSDSGRPVRETEEGGAL
jgi:glycosyltransferase involved in cell wall biosynthesis